LASSSAITNVVESLMTPLHVVLPPALDDLKGDDTKIKVKDNPQSRQTTFYLNVNLSRTLEGH
jgi:hypothetical protein